ncbi:MAG: energy-coupling factor ABC transporter ATP-binding protein [Methanospirillum sp.]|nr:energy-coupling factor ABC transporter ATP-binding protein [Methanospirillum sp.]
MISIRALRQGVLDIEVLDINPGITSVIGPNGSGKTTLLRLLSGISLPECGTIFIDDLSPRAVETGWVNEFPDRNILFDTVADEIASPLRFHRVSCRETDTLVTDLMTRMRISHLQNRGMQDLSGGEKILTALAAAIVCNPRILVLDEYDSHLDENRAREIEEILKKSTIPYIIRCTQQMESASRGNGIIYLENGRVVHQGSPDKVFAALAGTAFYPFSMRCGI